MKNTPFKEIAMKVEGNDRTYSYKKTSSLMENYLSVSVNQKPLTDSEKQKLLISVSVLLKLPNCILPQ